MAGQRKKERKKERKNGERQYLRKKERKKERMGRVNILKRKKERKKEGKKDAGSKQKRKKEGKSKFVKYHNDKCLAIFCSHLQDFCRFGLKE